jgi:diguanylate cyclase
MAGTEHRTAVFARPRAMFLYLTAVIVAGCGLLVHAAVSLARVPAGLGDGHTVAVVVLAVLIVVGEMRHFLTKQGRDGAAIAVAFSLAMISLAGWWWAVAAQCLAIIVCALTHRHALWRGAFNVSQHTVSLAVAGVVFDALCRVQIGPGQHLGDQGWPRSLALMAAGFVYGTLNHLLVWIAVALQKGVSVLGQVRRIGLHQVRATGAMVVLSPLAAVVALAQPWMLPLFIPVLFIVHGNAEAGEQRAWESNHDELTELPNRKMLRAEGGLALAEAMRTGRSVGLLLLDLDRFKEVNDTLGHVPGDRLLQKVAGRLSRAVDPRAMVARLGGDEFAVLLPRVASLEEAIGIARQLCETFEEPFEVEEIALDLEASVGVALFPEHAEEFDQLLQRADVAMYQAKRARCGVAAYEAGRDQNTLDRLALLGDLRRALEAGEVQLHYQPKVSFATKQVVGFEGLVRWKHATRGSVNPEEFVELAEQTGLMPKLTEYVVDQALSQVAKWWRSGLAVPVAVNVSMRDIHQPGFVPKIQAGLLKYGVPPTALQLEITERVLLEDPKRAAATLAGLEALGVRLSLDDFGTGYSSLVLLRKIPVAEIKIDKSFVAHLAHDPEDAAIVRSTVDLAHSLGLHVVAEGVEDDETWDRLAALGCDAAQGWLLAKALPPQEATQWLNGRTAGPDRETYLVR